MFEHRTKVVMYGYPVYDSFGYIIKIAYQPSWRCKKKDCSSSSNYRSADTFQAAINAANYHTVNETLGI